MKTYIVIKELPDAYVGTEVLWDENGNYYYYQKNAHVSPHDRTFLTKEQVTKNAEHFYEAENYPSYYTWHYPVYSRKEICELVEKCFPNYIVSGEGFRKSVAEEIRRFEQELRALGNKKVEERYKNKKI
jgi:hypothetical protein